jgi:hypothetical protein
VSPRKFTVSQKLSKFSFSNCQNFLFQTVKIFFFKLYEKKLAGRKISDSVWETLWAKNIKGLETSYSYD